MKSITYPHRVPLMLFVATLSLAGCARELPPQTARPAVAPLESVIAKGEASLRKNPGDVRASLALGNAYLQKIRETADGAYYAKIDALLAEAQKKDPRNAEIFFLQATALGGRHSFRDALAAAQKAIRLDPTHARYYGILADAQIELGLYDEAAGSLQKMADRRPDFSTLTRVSHLRELHGDLPGAREAMQGAIDAGAAFPENLAWAHVEMGKLFLGEDLPRARRECEQVIAVLPGFARALQCLGHVAWAEGKRTDALGFFQQAFDALPIAEHATDLGDIHLALGDTAKAKQFFTLTQAGYRATENGGTRIDLEEARFLADHDLDPEAALAKAKQAYADRPSIDGADTLAWVLLQQGNPSESQKYMTAALRLNTRNPLLRFHAGMIAQANGDREAAKRYLNEALALDPHFSIPFADAARHTLESL